MRPVVWTGGYLGGEDACFVLQSGVVGPLSSDGDGGVADGGAEAALPTFLIVVVDVRSAAR